MAEPKPLKAARLRVHEVGLDSGDGSGLGVLVDRRGRLLGRLGHGLRARAVSKPADQRRDEREGDRARGPAADRQRDPAFGTG